MSPTYRHSNKRLNMRNEMQPAAQRTYAFIPSARRRKQLLFELLFKCILLIHFYRLLFGSTFFSKPSFLGFIALLVFCALLGLSVYQYRKRLKSIQLKIGPRGLALFPLSLNQLGNRSKTMRIHWAKIRDVRFYLNPAWWITKASKQLVFFPAQNWRDPSDLSIAPPIVLPIEDKDQTLYVGLDHALTVEEVVTLFAGPIPQASSIQAQQIDKAIRHAAQPGMQLDPRMGHVSHTALLLFVLCLVLSLFLPKSVLAEGTPITQWCVAISLLTALAAIAYLRNAKPRALIAIPALLAAAAAAAFTFCITVNLPNVLGQRTRLAFVLIEQSDTGQVWQAVTDAQWRFNIYAPRQKRYFNVLQTQQTLTALKGPFGMRAISSNELDKLRAKRF